MAENNGRFSGVRALIFDLDGTLIDSQLDLVLSVNAMLEHMVLRTPRPRKNLQFYREWRAHAGAAVPWVKMPRKRTSRKASPIFCSIIARTCWTTPTSYPGVREALAQLREYPMAVLTNKPVHFSRAIIEGLELSRYFRNVYGGNSFETKKPDPRGRAYPARRTASRAPRSHDGGRFRRGHQNRAQRRNARLWRNLRLRHRKSARASTRHNAR